MAILSIKLKEALPASGDVTMSMDSKLFEVIRLCTVLSLFNLAGENLSRFIRQ